MKKLILSLSFLILFCNNLKSAIPQLIEHVVPQYFGSKSGPGTNECRTPFAICLEIINLTPNTTYDIRIGVVEDGEPFDRYGAGNLWIGTAFDDTELFRHITTKATGNTGPFWCFIQPSGAAVPSRFNAGQVHVLRVGYRLPLIPGSSWLAPNFQSSRKLRALDIPINPRTTTTTDDGAFFKAYNLCYSGFYALIYNNETGTGDPMSAYQIRNCTATNPSQSQLPPLINDYFNQSGTSSLGDFAGTIPIGANNPNGVRRIEIRYPDNSIYFTRTDADGIWPDGTNTTTLERRDVANTKVHTCGIIDFHRDASYKQEQDVDISDTVTLHLRQTFSPFAIVSESKSKLDTNGSGSFIFSDIEDSVNYYLTVTHRNSIETWSSEGHSFSNALMTYSFSTAITQAYGNNMIQIDTNPVLFGVYGGDVNQDGEIDLNDVIQTFNDANSFMAGYVVTDITLDNVTDLNDVLFAYNNSVKFVTVVRP